MHHVPNFAEIGGCRFISLSFNHQDGGRSPSWIFEIQISLTARRVCRTKVCYRTKFSHLFISHYKESLHMINLRSEECWQYAVLQTE